MILEKTTLAAVLVLASAAIVPAHGLDHPMCSDGTLHGDYAFTITGQILSPAPVAGPVAGVAMTHFDGVGNMTQVDHVVHNGVVPVEEWRPGNGPYHVNRDCTGYMVITATPSDPADASPVLKVDFVVGNDGNDIRTVVTGSPSTPPFTAAIISTATKVYQPATPWAW